MFKLKKVLKILLGTLVLMLSVTPQLSFSAIIDGNPKGSVTLEEIYDYQCPHCHNAYSKVESLIDHNKFLKVRLMPAGIINQLSNLQALAAIAATRFADKFYQLHNLMLTEHPANLNEFLNQLSDLGLNNSEFKKDMRSQWANEELERNNQIAQSVGSAPIFIIYPSFDKNKVVVIKGDQDIQVLQSEINKAKMTISSEQNIKDKQVNNNQMNKKNNKGDW